MDQQNVPLLILDRTKLERSLTEEFKEIVKRPRPCLDNIKGFENVAFWNKKRLAEARANGEILARPIGEEAVRGIKGIVPPAWTTGQLINEGYIGVYRMHLSVVQSSGHDHALNPSAPR